MRARVFVTLEAIGVRSAGPDDRRRAAFARLRRRRGRAAGQVLRARPGDDRGRAGARRWRPKSPTSCSRIRSSRAIASKWTERRVSLDQPCVNVPESTADSMKFAVVVFPGSNCDHDAYHAATARARPGGRAHLAQGHRPEGRRRRRFCPGGFAHGDYLRTGAMARFSPIMREVKAFAERGGPVLGICNGFQILLEAGLLPGAMLRNRGLKYRCEHVHVRVEQTDTPFTCGAPRRPGAADSDRPRRRQLLRAARRARSGSKRTGRSSSVTPTADGALDDAANPNGSVNAIAGICNEARNVVGMMPHPERACEPAAWQRRRPGRSFESVVKAFDGGRWQPHESGAADIA